MPLESVAAPVQELIPQPKPAAAATVHDAVAVASQAILDHDAATKTMLANRQVELEVLTAHPDPRLAEAHRAETNELALAAINRKLDLVRAYHRAMDAAAAPVHIAVHG